ncbi:hypothetical protein [Brevibacillus sp. FSL L8-0710]|uniref:hypothetical protein n=1 Tax=Brevibacillus sp. FSL L8-0710 TaxID=2975313 RepID=UPI0030F946E5
MNKEELIKNLESLYVDYYDGLYNDEQLKLMLKKLYLKVNIDASEWSELILDAQWKYATEEDYKQKRQQIAFESQNERGGVMFFCKCGGFLLVKDVEEYPSNLDGSEKLYYERKCSATCSVCGHEYENLAFD